MPAFEFFLTLGSAYYAAGFIFWVAISFVGVAVMKLPPKYLWGLIVGGLVVVFLGLWERAETAQGAAKFKAKVTGEDNYAYFHSRKGRKRAGRFLLYLKGVGDSPDVRICIYRLAGDGRQYDEKCPPAVTIRAVNAEVGLAIPAGRWQFHFSAQYNNRWIQTLIFSEGFQVLEEVIDVRREGKTKSLYSRTKFYPIRLESNVTRKIPIPRRSPQKRQVGPASRGTSD